MIFLQACPSCLATTEGEGLAGESRPEMLLKYLMRKISSNVLSNLDGEVGSSADVSVVVGTNSVEGSSLGEGKEQAETSKEQNLVRKVVVSQTWLSQNLQSVLQGKLGTQNKTMIKSCIYFW